MEGNQNWTALVSKLTAVPSVPQSLPFSVVIVCLFFFFNWQKKTKG